MFQKLVQSMDLSAQALSSYLDLQGLWQELLKVPEFKFPYQGKPPFLNPRSNYSAS